MAFFINQENAREEENRQNRRLEAVAFLRNSNAMNRQRMSQVRSILYGEPYVPAEQEGEKLGKTNDENSGFMDNGIEEHAFWLSFWRRIIICSAIIALLYIGNSSQDAFMDKYKKEMKSIISKDYSENLFDFIQQIPYTFEYEKINVEG